MGQNSNIEWTDHTFNPWVGCVKVSEGCKHCYAETFMTRKSRWANTWGPAATTERIRTKTWSDPLKWNREAKAAGKRARVFCASLADVFEDNPQLVEWRADLLHLIIDTPWLDWQILTKRPENVCRMIEQATGFSDAGMWFHAAQNVWIGTSVENQKRADERRPELLKIPAAVRFLSIEPLLGSIYIHQLHRIHWVIVGGESGPKARPLNPEWVRSIRDQCQEAGVSFFFKQWGEWTPVDEFSGKTHHDNCNFFASGQAIEKIGKKAAGNILDGRQWLEMPEDRK